jgi:hypothetical protein
MYYIWSYEHQGWWKPNRQGYTIFLSDAGEYSAKEAGEICANANRVQIEEIMVSHHLAFRFGRPTSHPYPMTQPRPQEHWPNL